jgi:hypothetical protein
VGSHLITGTKHKSRTVFQQMSFSPHPTAIDSYLTHMPAIANISSHDALRTTTTTDTTSFVSCNPGRAVQMARGWKKGQPLSNSQKLDHKEATAVRKVYAEDLAGDIEAFCSYRSNLIVSLATQHDRETQVH